MQNRISLHIVTLDRLTELCTLLCHLRLQTYQNWDLIIVDDFSGNILFNHHTLASMIQRIKLEKHKVKLIRNPFRMGVCKARQKAIDEDNFGNSLIMRIDDDSLPDIDYLQRLVNFIDIGYDMAGGIYPIVANPELQRRVKYISPIINKVELNEDGSIKKMGDDCGHSYYESAIIPAHHLRSSFLYKKEIADKIKYEQGLSPSGFREETFYCLRAMLLGYKMAVDTGAKAWHLMTPSGGCRGVTDNYRIDEQTFQTFMKRVYAENPNFLKEYDRKVLNDVAV